MSDADAVEVEPVSGTRGVAEFIRAAACVRGDDPSWVAPLRMERKQHLGPRNPFFTHAEARYFVARRKGEPVGRISGQIDRLAQPRTGSKLAHFGFVEARDRAVMSALLKAVETWARERGAGRIAGPFSLSINDEVGLRVEGFDRPARLLMNDAPAWYGPAIEGAGYTGVKDLIAYDFDVTRPLPARARRMAEQTAAEPRVRERPLDPRHLYRDVRTIIDIFNDAWSENWGFVPMTAEEVGALVQTLRPIIKPEMVRIAEVDGEPAAMIVALPDLNEALHGLRGRLLPFGWLKLVWRLKMRGVRGGRVMLMGVRRAHHASAIGRGVPVLLIQRLHSAALAEGVRDLELSWVLDDNRPTRRMVESVGGVASKRYRIYAKDLTA